MPLSFNGTFVILKDEKRQMNVILLPVDTEFLTWNITVFWEEPKSKSQDTWVTSQLEWSLKIDGQT